MRLSIVPASSAPIPLSWKARCMTSISPAATPVLAAKSLRVPPRSSVPFIALKTPLNPAKAARAAKNAPVNPAAATWILRIWPCTRAMPAKNGAALS